MMSVGGTQVSGGQPGASSVAAPLAQKPEKSKPAFGTIPAAGAWGATAIPSKMLDKVWPKLVLNAIAADAPPTAGNTVSASKLNAVAGPPLPPAAPAPPLPPAPASLLPHPVQAMDESKRAVLKTAVRMMTSCRRGSPLMAMR
jgi:hypothetical protein